MCKDTKKKGKNLDSRFRGNDSNVAFLRFAHRVRTLSSPRMRGFMTNQSFLLIDRLHKLNINRSGIEAAFGCIVIEEQDRFTDALRHVIRSAK
jgi:hypothetical protein